MKPYIVGFLVVWFLATLVLASLFDAPDGDAIVFGAFIAALFVIVVAIFA